MIQGRVPFCTPRWRVLVVIVAVIVMTAGSLVYWEDTWDKGIVNVVALILAVVAMISLEALHRR